MFWNVRRSAHILINVSSNDEIIRYVNALQKYLEKVDYVLRRT